MQFHPIPRKIDKASQSQEAFLKSFEVILKTVFFWKSKTQPFWKNRFRLSGGRSPSSRATCSFGPAMLPRNAGTDGPAKRPIPTCLRLFRKKKKVWLWFFWCFSKCLLCSYFVVKLLLESVCYSVVTTVLFTLSIRMILKWGLKQCSTECHWSVVVEREKLWTKCWATERPRITRKCPLGSRGWQAEDVVPVSCCFHWCQNLAHVLCTFGHCKKSLNKEGCRCNEADVS